jgi:hypothetical protein
MKNKIKLPPRKWYSLQQAAEKLSKYDDELTVNDLINYWLNDEIEFHTTIKYFLDGIQLGNLLIEDKDIVYFDIDIYSDALKEISEVGFIRDSLISVFDSHCVNELINAFSKSEVKEIKFDESRKTTLSIDGLVRLPKPHSLSDQLKSQSKIKVDSITEIVIETDKGILFFGLETTLKEQYINLDEVFITQKSLEAFINKYKEEHKEISPKTQNAQSRFIRDLLAIHYDLNTAQEIRNALDNSRSKISRDFELKGLNKPNGKTIYNYINKIED